jgi:hypothetical protein
MEAKIIQIGSFQPVDPLVHHSLSIEIIGVNYNTTLMSTLWAVHVWSWRSRDRPAAEMAGGG